MTAGHHESADVDSNAKPATGWQPSEGEVLPPKGRERNEPEIDPIGDVTVPDPDQSNGDAWLRDGM